MIVDPALAPVSGDKGLHTLHLSVAGGLTQFGAYLDTLEPGVWSSHRHWHSSEDEFLYLLSGTATQALAVTYGASADAVDYRSEIFDLTATLTEAIEAQAEGTYASEMSAARRAIATLESAIAADVNETIGRLPAIKTFSPGRAIDALQLAQHIAGDRPAEIESVYRDIVARNRPRHPAAIDGERIEVAL